MDRSIWMGIAPGREATRLIAQRGPSETILKANLRRRRRVRRHWSGCSKRSRCGKGGRSVLRSLWTTTRRSASATCIETGSRHARRRPLYQIDWIPRARPRRRHDSIRGMGEFGDLEQLLRFEIAR